VSVHPPLLLVTSSRERERWLRRGRMITWGAIAWHLVEFAIAISAGIAAGSVALVAFGADSLIEAGAGLVLAWLFSGRRLLSEASEGRARRLIAISFFVLTAYVIIEAGRALISTTEPSTSWPGIALAAFTAATMPLLARAKTHVARGLDSRAAESESKQTMLCAYLSLALLAGLGANALLGWWWADPIAGLAVAAVAFREGLAGWRGEAGACCAPTGLKARRRGLESRDHAGARACERGSPAGSNSDSSAVAATKATEIHRHAVRPRHS
jgi:divalent metal cation (Fe/Co/Zn/Cd) transporter